jgi:hypothetical protein
MKIKIYALALIAMMVAVTSSCLKNNSSVTTSVTIPIGTFSGKFAYLHRKTDNVAFDTLLANIVLTTSATGTTYAVTGDTTTLHAGSMGSFQINSTYMDFVDSTVPKSGIVTKKHLNGLYLYAFDGTTLKLLMNQSDTASYQYQLTKSN